MNALSTLIYTVRGNAHIHTIIHNIAIACTEPNNFMFTHASTDLNISTKSRYIQYPHTHRRTNTQCPMYAPVARKSRKSTNALDVNPQIFSYIDDCILLWRHGWKGLTALLDHFNGQHTTINFTMEHSVNETQSVNSSTPEAEDRSMSIEELLERNDYPRTEINAARRAAKGKRQDTHPSQQQQRDSKRRHNQFKAVIKLPFINDSLAARVSRRVRKFSPHVRVVFVSGPSLKDMLVRSSSAVRVCPREKQRSEVKRGRSRPMECRACDASMVDSQCLVKGVVYCMSYTLCAELYIGETKRLVRDRFAEHYREALAMVAKAPWGFHYRTQHR